MKFSSKNNFSELINQYCVTDYAISQDNHFNESLNNLSSILQGKIDDILNLKARNCLPEELINLFLGNVDPSLRELYSIEFLDFLKVGVIDHFNYLLERMSSLSFHFFDPQRLSQKRFFTKNDAEFSKILMINEDDNQEFIQKWIRKFGIGDKIELTTLYANLAFSIHVVKDGNRYNLADMGFGFSQILPMLATLANDFTADDTRVLLDTPTNVIEEPESNLHPALQSMLADFFSEVSARFQVKFLIESHSEYLVRKLQYLVGKGELDSSNVCIYYLSENSRNLKSEDQLKQIEINDDGSLTNDFGKGFYDEAINWKFELLKIKNPQKN